MAALSLGPVFLLILLGVYAKFAFKIAFNLFINTYFVQQSLLEKQQEFVEKLEEVCDNLTSTENHLIGHQQQMDNAESVTDLQQYQEEHQV